LVKQDRHTAQAEGGVSVFAGAQCPKRKGCESMIQGRIVKNFSLSEMMNTMAQDKTKLVITPELVAFAEMVQELRDYHGKPLNVSSWYRTPTFNKKCGGSPNSAHLDGRAVDLLVTDYHDLTIAWNVITARHGKIGGVNYYKTYMHFTDYEDKFGNKTFVVRDKR